jgi:hypothetical protein
LLTSPTPLADGTGIPAWIIDRVQSALGSFSATGLVSCLLIFGAHNLLPHVEIITPAPRVGNKSPQRSPQTTTGIAARGGDNVVALVPKAANGVVSVKPMRDFLAQCVPEAASDDEVEWGDMFKRYRSWHARILQPGENLYTAAEFGAVLARSAIGRAFRSGTTASSCIAWVASCQRESEHGRARGA